MLNLHQVNGFGHALGFIPIHFQWSPGSYIAETTTACTNISEYHECSRALAPAFSHIGTIAALTNRVQLMCVYEIAYVTVFFADGQFDAEPIGFLCPDSYGSLFNNSV